jgi:hypothetical protein
MSNVTNKIKEREHERTTLDNQRRSPAQRLLFEGWMFRLSVCLGSFSAKHCPAGEYARVSVAYTP